MEEKKSNAFFTLGTPQCGFLLALIGAALALLLVFIGFWRTLLVAALAAVGYYVGAVGHKSAALKDTVNKMFPPKGE